MNKIKKIFSCNDDDEEKNEFKEFPNLDKLYNDPVQAWEIRSEKQNVEKLQHMDPSTPVSEDKVRFVCISDTHDYLKTMLLKKLVPPGDVLIHTGDITMHGDPQSIVMFNELLGFLPHKIKLVIGGNHDICLDRSVLTKYGEKPIPVMDMSRYDVEDYVKHCTKCEDKKEVRLLLSNGTYLEDSMVDVFGINIYGSPWVVAHNLVWGFSLKRGVPLLKKWNLIPETVDILMTHYPPLGYGDYCHKGYHVGCVDLLNAIQNRIQPKYHVFGHIHEGYGVHSDGITTFINASSCTKQYRPVMRPIIFDYPLPVGHIKSETVKILKDISDYDVNFHTQDT